MPRKPEMPPRDPRLKMTVDEKIDRLLAEIMPKLESPNQLLKEAHDIPVGIAAAFMASRPELARLSPPESLPPEQIKGLYDFIATLLETNNALRDHAAKTAVLVSTWMSAVNGMQTAARRVESFANFRFIIDEEEEEATDEQEEQAKENFRQE